MTAMHDLLDYPIKQNFNLIAEQLKQNTPLALEAPTGSGKTTLLPILLYLAGLSEKKILITQPRRIAAKNTAGRINMLLGAAPGEFAGYRVRGESVTTASTVIEVVTEGYALAMLQADPFLSGYSWVILDEFHERHIEADLLLAFLRDLRTQLGAKESPSLILMSATWQGQPTEILKEFIFHSVEGRLFPVEKIFWDGKADSSVEKRLDWAVEHALSETEGRILVFLPGRREITSALNRFSPGHPELEISVLHGGLDLREQTRVIGYNGKARQLILSTSIAETSLTIEGVTAVIDSGLERMPQFLPSGGLTRLVTRRLSRATSEQRAGRAGRLGPGKCYRLWNRQEDSELVERWEPEILTGDLSSARLQAAVWGDSNLPWMTPPPDGMWDRAGDLLHDLGAVDEDGRPTPRGRLICRMPLHPRLSHMVIESERPDSAAFAASLLTEGPSRDARGKTFSMIMAEAANSPVISRLKKQSDDIERLAAGYRKPESAGTGRSADESVGLMLARAYPDRIGRRTDASNYMLSTGAPLYCPECSSDWAVFPEISDNGKSLTGIVYEPVAPEELRESMPQLFRVEREVSYRVKDGGFRAAATEMLGRISCRQLKAEKPDREEIYRAVAEAVNSRGLKVLPFGRKASQLLQRLAAARAAGFSEFPDPDEKCLAAEIAGWLIPFVKDRITEDTIAAAVEALPDWEQQKMLNRLLPKEAELSPGHYVEIDYSNPIQPTVSARIQEFYGLTKLPEICEGRLKLTAEMLSPARRPLQVTSDLEEFWKGSYAVIRAEMRGRYPKHYWPEDPAASSPSLATGKNRPK